MTRPDPATERQIAAADPAGSTWVTANAGSGKTRVLIDRVARLLLQGVEPQQILCLTYTKAAAAEMQIRLFQRLGEWAMRPDDALRRELVALGEGGGLADNDLAAARRLFARALETPGGLRIQTIHSFCAGLLRRFPLEARLSPGFTELDDRSARQLRGRIIEDMAERLAPDALAGMAEIYSGQDMGDLAAQVASNAAGFEPALSRNDCLLRYGLTSDTDTAQIMAGVISEDSRRLVEQAIPVLAKGLSSDIKMRDALALFLTEADPRRQFAALQAAYLTKKDGSLLKKPFTKNTITALGDLHGPLIDLGNRVEQGRRALAALAAAEKTLALHRFAQAFLPLYKEAKSRRGALDFDDLIARSIALLTDPKVAAWVLFRLDGGIGHVLVDEAQDTSPGQWRVIELLTAEFTAGEGAGKGARTLFVVGDKKQSIYSFQGADVAAFEEKHQQFEESFRAARLPFETTELLWSFRSAPAVLRVVDQTFAGGFASAMGQRVEHLAYRAGMPGRVDLWPLIEPVEKTSDDDWENPVDLISETHHAAQLATRIATEIRRMIDTRVQIDDGQGKSRPVHEGDFLVLVQRRSDLFHEIIRACKKAGLAIAGADRLKLGGEMAVKDLRALLAFLTTPEDDLSLACVLRSPLFGWSEDALFRLAHGRKGFLWEALRNHEGPSEARQILGDLLDQADFLRPFDLLERALTRHDGRRRLLARLGEEAIDGVDAFLAQAMAYEETGVPSLTGFLVWIDSDSVEIKRQMDGAGNRLRVMTVHGAKGLEAPIVILPDTVDRRPQDRDEVLRLGDGTAVWKVPATEAPPIVAEVMEDRRHNSADESARLLYVALTRARNWLIVAGAGKAEVETTAGPKEDTALSWYRLVERAMQACGADRQADGTLRVESGEWPPDAPAAVARPAPQARQLPDWIAQPAPPVADRPRPLSPSDLGGSKVLPGEGDGLPDDTAKARGTALHLLLEHLPKAKRDAWPLLAARLVPDRALCDDVLAEAAGCLDQPGLGWLFAPSVLAEVPIVAQLGAREMAGTIDRLVIDTERVLAVDFKSNAVVPADAAAVPEGLLRQMGAYAEALRQIYPGRRVDTAVLWTRTAGLMPLDPDIVSAALHRAAIP